MRNTKIDWCTATWNPVTGCLHHCSYCYAEKIANRFAGCVEAAVVPEEDIEECVKNGATDQLFVTSVKHPPLIERERNGMPSFQIAPYPYGFQPTLHLHKLEEPQHWKQPQRVFVCSMADLFGNWVPDQWILKVFKACRMAPQHTYYFLTKNPARYQKLASAGLLPKQDNFWYGTTVTAKNQPYFSGQQEYRTFLSLEPLLEPVVLCSPFFNWVIIGAETGNRKEKVAPKADWIRALMHNAVEYRIPVFCKESVKELLSPEEYRQELPGKNREASKLAI